MLANHLHKEHLHHAYVLEGNKEILLPELFSFFEEIGLQTIGNPDFVNLSYDVFKRPDAEKIRKSFSEKSFSDKKEAKKFFIISANNFLPEAQNMLLKTLEEPMLHTHFFLITADTSVLLPTIISRSYLISLKAGSIEETKEADKFIKMNLSARLEYIKDLAKGKDDEDEEEVSTESPRAKALHFLAALEKTLSKSTLKNNVAVIDQIFKVREFLRQPGSSTKMLMESVVILL